MEAKIRKRVKLNVFGMSGKCGSKPVQHGTTGTKHSKLSLYLSVLELRLTSTCKSCEIKKKGNDISINFKFCVPACSLEINPHLGSSHLSYLDFDVADFVHCPDDRPAHHRGEYVSREIAAGVSAFHELQGKGEVSNQSSHRGDYPISDSTPYESPPQRIDSSWAENLVRMGNTSSRDVEFCIGRSRFDAERYGCSFNRTDNRRGPYRTPPALPKKLIPPQ